MKVCWGTAEYLLGIQASPSVWWNTGTLFLSLISAWRRHLSSWYTFYALTSVFFSLSLTLSLSFLLHRTGFPINPSYSLIPYTPLTNSSTIQKCHSSSHCHPHFQPSPPSVPFCSWAEKQLKQFSCRELLSLIAMKDTFSHRSLGDFFSLSLFLSVWVEM